MVEQADTQDRYKLKVLMTTCVGLNRGGGEGVMFHLPGQMPRIKKKSAMLIPILFHEVGNHKQRQIATIAGGIRNLPSDRLLNSVFIAISY